MPLPLSLIEFGLPGALLVTVSVALAGPRALGIKCTITFLVPWGGITALKAAQRKAPGRDFGNETVTLTAVLFLIVKVRVLTSPTGVPPKDTLDGLKHRFWQRP